MKKLLQIISKIFIKKIRIFLAGFRGQSGGRGRGGARGVGESKNHYDEEIIESEEDSGSELLFRVNDVNLAVKTAIITMH